MPATGACKREDYRAQRKDKECVCVCVRACAHRVWDARDGSVPSHLLNGQEEAQASRLSNTATATPSAGTAPAAAARRSVEPATHLPGAAAMFDSLQQGGASQQQAHNAAYNGSVDRGDLPMTGGADNNGQADAPTDALVQNSVRFVDNGRTIVSAGAVPLRCSPSSQDALCDYGAADDVHVCGVLRCMCTIRKGVVGTFAARELVSV